jgi:Glycosyl transferase family 2
MPDHVGVVVPTRNRPDDLARCLDSLAAARERVPFRAWVCDSSDDEHRPGVEAACATHDFVGLHFHDRTGIAAARNFAVEIANAELLVSVDDDIVVEPQTIKAMVDAYEAGTGLRVVGGAVNWGDGKWRTAPMTLRRIGYGRHAKPEEAPDCLNSALVLYPKAFAQTWPWHEGLKGGSDIFMSAMWRSAGVTLLGAPEARADHAPSRSVVQEAADQDDFIYVLLTHTLIADREPVRALRCELFGFAAGLKAFWRGGPRTLATFVTAWLNGHRAFVRDRRLLREMASRTAPAI